MQTRILLSVCVVVANAAAALAQSADRETIVNTLQPKPLTRSMTRGIVIKGETRPNPDPQINLHISFDYRSAELLRDGKVALDELVAALKDKRLANMQFRVVGHTDARGGEEYNLDLSTRRADAVKAYLVDHNIAVSRLIAEGKGKTELFDPSRPDDAINRRVQIVTMTVPTN